MRGGIATVFAGFMAFFFISGCSESPKEVIKIGHAVDLTGNNSSWGIAEKKAIAMRIEKINAAGGVLGRKLLLVSYDTRANAAEGAKITQRLISEGSCAIIGPDQSDVAIAMGEIAEAGKVPFVGTATTNPKVTMDAATGEPRKFAFRACVTDIWQGKAVALFATRDLGHKTAGVICQDRSEYSLGLGKFFAQEFENLGGKVLAKEVFQPKEIDFRAILGKMKELDPDVLFVPTTQQEAALMMKQASEMGLRARFIGADNWGSIDLMTLGGPAVEGSFSVNHMDLADPAIQAFIKEYKAEYNENPILPNAIMGVDALYMIIDSITRAGSSHPVKIAEQLEKVKNVPVLSGNMTIDPATHSPLDRYLVIQQARGNDFVFYKKIVP